MNTIVIDVLEIKGTGSIVEIIKMIALLLIGDVMENRTALMGQTKKTVVIHRINNPMFAQEANLNATADSVYQTYGFVMVIMIAWIAVMKTNIDARML
jgi:hypothetical protein